jgi:hypothetical protein
MKKLFLICLAAAFSSSVNAVTIKIEKCEPVIGQTPKNGWNKPEERHQCEADVHTLECSAGGNFACDWSTPPSSVSQYPTTEQYIYTQIYAGILTGVFEDVDGSFVTWDATVPTWVSIQITSATRQCSN